MKSLGIVLIGTGVMGKRQASAWRSAGPIFGDTPGVRREMLADVPDAKARTCANQRRFACATGDWKTLIPAPGHQLGFYDLKPSRSPAFCAPSPAVRPITPTSRLLWSLKK